MNARHFDGFFCGDKNGALHEIFAPRWWRLDRWVRWWLTPRAEQTKIELRWFQGDGAAWSDEVRARVVKRTRLTNVPSAQARHYQ